MECWFNVIGTLMEATWHPADEIIRTRWEVRVGVSDIMVYISGDGGDLPPSRPPFLRYRWVMKAMTETPAALTWINLKTPSR